MTPIVVLALALMVTALGAAVVAALLLRRAAAGFTAGVRATTNRLQPLADELQESTEVTATEVETLQASVDRLKAVRQGRSRRSR